MISPIASIFDFIRRSGSRNNGRRSPGNAATAQGAVPGISGSRPEGWSPDKRQRYGAPDTPTARRQADAAAGMLPSLLVEAQYVASTVAQGVHGRRRVGPGESFWQFRRYTHGDTLARVDWRQSGKSRHVFVREYEWEASQTVALWRDSGASMTYRSMDTLPTKRHRTDVLVLGLALLLNRGGERIALLGAPAPPTAGRINLDRFASQLEGLGPIDDAALAAIPRHASAVLIGDFIDAPERVESALTTLAARSVHGHLLQVLDPAEATLPFTGRIRFRDVESPREMLVPRVQGIRSDYLRRLAERQDRLARAARRAGWTFAVHRTDHTVQAGLIYLYGALSGDPAITGVAGRSSATRR